MKLLLAIALLCALFVNGCNRRVVSNEAPTYRDSVLRQKLTDMLMALHSDRGVVTSINELNAILAVNASRLTSDQYEKLTAAKNKLVSMRHNLERFAEDQSRPGYLPDKSNAEYVGLFSDAKRLIAEAASTL